MKLKSVGALCVLKDAPSSSKELSGESKDTRIYLTVSGPPRLDNIKIQFLIFVLTISVVSWNIPFV